MRPFLRLTLCLSLLALVAAQQIGVSVAATVAAQPSAISFWGMNAYLTKDERFLVDSNGVRRDNIELLMAKTRAAGVQWTREEFPWAEIEKIRGRYATYYDSRILQVAAQDLGIIGMLLTTPEWAREASCRGSYWCPPTAAHVQSYANFAAWMVERYDGDGTADAPGSPRVAYWEIWNEPNDTALWHDIGTPGVTRKQRYGELLVAAYAAIKRADPTAKVLIGGLYIYDGSNAGGLEDGFYFLNATNGVFRQVPAARNAYDIFSIHPYIPTARPEAPESPPIISVEGRIKRTRDWLNDPLSGNRATNPPPIWVTEIGWCTEPSAACGAQWSEDQQANFLVRSMVIAQHSGTEHLDWFQLEDASNQPRASFNSMAILRDLSGGDYAPKPAYTAYATLARLLTNAQAAGTGPVHTHVYNGDANRGNEADIYDYRYTRDGRTIDVIWRAVGSSTISFPVQAGQQVVQVSRNGTETTLVPQGGAVRLVVTETPFYIVQGNPARLVATPSDLTLMAKTGSTSVSKTLSITNGGSGALQWQVVAKPDWLTVQPSSGSTPATVRVTASTAGFAPGTYTGSITLRSDGLPDLVVPVRLVIADRISSAYLPLILR